MPREMDTMLKISSFLLFYLWFYPQAVVDAQYQFPDGFKFGAATAAYQVEGAWNVSDKTESVWDRFVHTPGLIADGTTGDVTCDSYHKYKRDVEMIKDLELDFYRFSLSWPRILPQGFDNYISEDGSKYYSSLIDELLSKNIEPMVTIHHWDMPQKLQEMGGWTNPLSVNWLVDLARVAFDLYADRVKYWITVNEPLLICDMGYGSDRFAPRLNDSKISKYLCAKHVILAHAKVWHLFNDEYRPRYGGVCGITNQVMYNIPASDSQEDIQAASDLNDQLVGLYSHQLFTEEGGWPPALEKHVARKSAKQGYKESRLPAYSKEEIELMKGASDFYGVNFYFGQLATRNVDDDNITSQADADATNYFDKDWEITDIGWPIYAESFRSALRYVKDRYNNPPILITENGVGFLETTLDDDTRVNYYRDHLQQVLYSIYEDGCNITHYTAWSLMDNMEWSSGLSTKFGLYHVDFEDPERTRTPRKSAYVYKEIARTGTVDYSYVPPGWLLQQAGVNGEYQFPDGFKFGVATASYQIEGAWNVSDKSESIWDRMAHTPSFIEDGSTGDVVCDSYHKYKRDVEMIKDLELDFYRFSLSWPRILPQSFSNYISEDGTSYYSNLIDELIANGIEPMITLYHWDLPQRLQDLGGWTNPLIVDWFVEYARVVFDQYADRVKYWITINEPLSICDGGYGMAYLAPGLDDSEIAVYLCAKHIMLAHAKVWHLFNDEYRPRYGGSCGITNQVLFNLPASDTEDDIQAANVANDQKIGKYSHQLFTEQGGWPPALEKAVAEKSAKQGYRQSRLPAYSNKEIELMKGASDFYGLNFYYVRKAKREINDDVVNTATDVDVVIFYDENWDTNDIGWPITAEGFRTTLRYLKDNYNNPHMMIMENGAGSYDGTLNDDNRVRYYRDHLQQVLYAIHEDGCNITHYTAWSLMDNFEWSSGLSIRFGLHHVDFEDPERTRTPRKSAYVYKEIARTGTVDYSYVPQGY